MQGMQGFAGPSHCSCTSSLFTDFVVWPQASHSPVASFLVRPQGGMEGTGFAVRPIRLTRASLVGLKHPDRRRSLCRFLLSCRPGKVNCSLLIRQSHVSGKVSRTTRTSLADGDRDVRLANRPWSRGAWPQYRFQDSPSLQNCPETCVVREFHGAPTLSRSAVHAMYSDGAGLPRAPSYGLPPRGLAGGLA